MAVAVQHGRFIGSDDDALAFRLDECVEALSIVLMSRSGILPEADFYCPHSLGAAEHHAGDSVMKRSSPRAATVCSIASLALVAQEITLADPLMERKYRPSQALTPTASARRGLQPAAEDPFHWALDNLEEVERNNARHTVPGATRSCARMKPFRRWCLTLMTMTGSVSKWFARVFIDCYAAIPSESIRRSRWRCAKRASSVFWA